MFRYDVLKSDEIVLIGEFAEQIGAADSYSVPLFVQAYPLYVLELLLDLNFFRLSSELFF